MATTATNFNDFGIKEVADVRFYPTESITYDKQAGTLQLKTGAQHVLEFTTLKVSNFEFTAETTDARGGKGNGKIITWDHSREITLTLEDALLSLDAIKALFKSTASDKGITLTANSFPDNYSIVGTTFARDTSGHDHVFTFYVPNAKISADLNLTMEADGDPTVFSMSINVLRTSKTDDTMLALIPRQAIYTPGQDLFEAAFATTNNGDESEKA